MRSALLVWALTVVLAASAISQVDRASVVRSNVRIHNASATELTDVTVGGVQYGDVHADGTTEYKSWGPTYRLSPVSFRVSGERLGYVPLDYAGPALGEGSFTFVIKVPGDQGQRFSVDVLKE